MIHHDASVVILFFIMLLQHAMVFRIYTSTRDVHKPKIARIVWPHSTSVCYRSEPQQHGTLSM